MLFEEVVVLFLGFEFQVSVCLALKSRKLFQSGQNAVYYGLVFHGVNRTVQHLSVHHRERSLRISSQGTALIRGDTVLLVCIGPCLLHSQVVVGLYTSFLSIGCVYRVPICVELTEFAYSSIGRLYTCSLMNSRASYSRRPL